MTHEQSASRAPGFMERYYICRDTTGIMSRGFNISARLNKNISDTVLSNALRRVILACPFLTVNAFRCSTEVHSQGVENEFSGEHHKFSSPTFSAESSHIIAEDKRANGSNYQIKPVKKILYSNVVSSRTIETFDGSMLENFSKIRMPVDTENVTWHLHRVFEMASGAQYLTFSCNHVMFDGRSAVSFFQDLVEAVNVVSADEDAEMKEILYDYKEDNTRQLPDSSEHVTTLYNSAVWFKISAVLSHLCVPDFLSYFFATHIWRSSPDLNQSPLFSVVPFDGCNESKFQLLRFDSDHTIGILDQCKREKTTLTPMLAAKFSKAMDIAFTPLLGSFSQKCELVVCGRRYFPDQKSDTRYGLFVSAFSTYVMGSTIGNVARSLGEGLSRAISSRSPFSLAGLLKILNIWDYVMAFATDKEQRQTFEISNLGRIDISDGEWRVTDIVFSQGVTYAHVTLSVISTPEGGMNITIAFHEKLSAISADGDSAINRCIAEFTQDLNRVQKK